MATSIRLDNRVTPSCCKVAPAGRTVRPWSVLGVLVTVIIVACVLAWAKYQFGSLSTARAFLRGQAVVLYPETIKIQGGQSTTKSVVIQNNSLDEIVLLGTRPTCDCLVLGTFPMTIPPLKSHEISVRFSSNSEDARENAQHGVLIYTNSQVIPRLHLHVHVTTSKNLP